MNEGEDMLNLPIPKSSCAGCAMMSDHMMTPPFIKQQVPLFHQ